MLCWSAKRMMSAHIDCELSPEREADLARHLAGCPACVAHERSLRAAWAELQELPPPAAAADLWAGVERKLVRPSLVVPGDPRDDRCADSGRRDAPPARRDERAYVGVCERRATQPAGMDRWPETHSYRRAGPWRPRWLAPAAVAACAVAGVLAGTFFALQFPRSSRQASSTARAPAGEDLFSEALGEPFLGPFASAPAEPSAPSPGAQPGRRGEDAR
jgi:anti-sigma factor RsiW